MPKHEEVVMKFIKKDDVLYFYSDNVLFIDVLLAMAQLKNVLMEGIQDMTEADKKFVGITDVKELDEYGLLAEMLKSVDNSNLWVDDEEELFN